MGAREASFRSPGEPLLPSRLVRRLFVIAVAAFGLFGSGDLAASIWPTSSRRLEADLGASDIEVRRRAARRLVEVRGPAGRALVERALGDPDVEVRLAAVVAARTLA